MILFFMEMINKYWLLIALVFSNNTNAYIPDRCDWQDCEALANGESSGYGLLALIVIGVVLYIANNK
nr:hypothetical protein [Candidatus Pseudothioglobus singularis]